MTRSSRIVHVAVGVIEKQDEVLIAKRPDHVHMGGLWEFPGGKVEDGEDVTLALAREIHEELGVDVEQSLPLIQIPHEYPDKTVLLDVFRITEFRGIPHGKEQQPIRWVKKTELSLYSFPAANVPIIDALLLPSHYLITPEPDLERLGDFVKQFELSLLNGISLAQLRAKQLSVEQLKQLYQRLLPVAQRYNTQLYVNCDLTTATQLNIRHIHLSSQNLKKLKAPVAEKSIAASCHNLAEIHLAQDIGAKFIVLSPVAATRSHPTAQVLGWRDFEKLCAQCRLPVFALGGMRKEDTAKAISCGAQGIAGVSAFWEDG